MGSETVSVHLFDLVSGFQDPINVEELTRQCIRACEEGDVSLLPAPCGLKKAVPHDVKVQFVVLAYGHFPKRYSKQKRINLTFECRWQVLHFLLVAGPQLNARF